MTDCEILGISPWATGEEIRIAYLNKIKEFHPDIYRGNKREAVEMTEKINSAYSRLKSIIPPTPCPEITHSGKIYGAKSGSSVFTL